MEGDSDGVGFELWSGEEAVVETSASAHAMPAKVESEGGDYGQVDLV